VDNQKTLIAAIEEQEAQALGGGRLNEERRESIDHYLGKPYGDEEEGRSQVVMRDVADTVEWIKPSLLKIFCSGDEIARFDPVGPGDEAQAQQETDYINHVIQTKNNGFLIFHDWFHDALLQKNGYVWAQSVEETRQTRQTYRNLSDDEFALIAQNQELEIVEYSQETTIDPLINVPYTTHSCVVVEKRAYPCIKIRNVAPERVAVASDWSDVNFVGCPFLRVAEYLTISDLRQMGYDVDDDISDDGGEDEDKWIQAARDIDDMEEIDQEGADKSTRRVRTRFVWMQYDQDGDGIAELRHIVIVGTTILENEEADLIPVACITPTRLPHEHNGLSIDDAVADLQRIRTVLTRGFLDNMYLANNGRNVVDTTTVNLDDLLTVRPGGIVRNKGPVGNAIAPLLHPQIGGDIMSAIEYIDTVRENRTGVTRHNQGLDADSLNKTKGGMQMLMSASQQRIELIARMFAETGVKHLMLIIHALSLKNGRQAEMIKLRDQWIPVDPTSWKTRSDVTVSVGIGTGDKDQQMMHLTNIWQMQLAGLQLGITTPANMYQTATKMTQNAGFKQPELFWVDPAQQPPAPPQPSPEEIKAQAEAQKVQFQAQTQKELKQMELQDSAYKFQAEQQAQMSIDQNRQEWEARQKQLELQQQAQLAEINAAYKAQEDARRLEFEQWKARLDAETRIAIAQIQARVTLSTHQDNIAMQGIGMEREDAREAKESNES
jgi:hypothetical protein